MLLPAEIWKQVILWDFFFPQQGCASQRSWWQIKVHLTRLSAQESSPGLVKLKVFWQYSIITPHFKLGSSNEAEG